jgi:hypothetical protein
VTRRVHSEAERRLFFELCPVEGSIAWDSTRKYSFRVSEALRSSQGASKIEITDLSLKQKKHLVEFARGIVEQQVVDMSIGSSADSLTRFQVLQHDLHTQRSTPHPSAMPTKVSTVPGSGAPFSASMQSHVTPSTPQVLTGQRLLPGSGPGRPLSDVAQRPFSFLRQVPSSAKPVAKKPRGIASRGVAWHCRTCGKPIQGTNVLGKGCPFT